MSSTSQSIPITRRSRGGLAIAVGVLVAIAVAVTLIAVTGSSNHAGRAVKPNPKPVTPKLSSVLAPLSPRERAYVLGLAALTPRQAAAAYGTGPAATVGKSASSPTVQPNPDEQVVTPQQHALSPANALPGWLRR